MGGQWNRYPAKAHFVRCLSDLGTRKSSGRDSISETELEFVPGNDRRRKIAEEQMQFLGKLPWLKRAGVVFTILRFWHLSEPIRGISPPI